MKRILICIVALCITLPVLSRTSKGKEFWIGFMENLTLSSNGPPTFQIHVSSKIVTTCTVTIPFTAFTATFVVGANQVYVYTLPSGIYYPQGDETKANNGIRVNTKDSVEVKAFHQRLFFSESTQVLPVSELGTEYLIMATDDTYSVAPSEFVVVALQNNTVIEIIPTAVTISTRPVGIPFTATLQAGQMYQIQAIPDISGTSVRSLDPLKKIAVFGGARQARVWCNTGDDDHIYDQLYPISSFGKVYHVVPFARHLFDVVKILASQNSTSISITGAQSYTLNKGQAVTFTINATCEITSDKPIAVAQLATPIGCSGPPQNATGGPGMIVLVPADLRVQEYVFYTFASMRIGGSADFYPLHNVNLVIKSSAIGNAKLDNVIIPTVSFSPVPGNSNYSFARLSMDTLAILQHTLSCDSGFNATTYCFTYANFYGHHLGYHKPEAVVTVTAGVAEHMMNAPQIFPNPAGSEIIIWATDPIASYTITDAIGRTILLNSSVNKNTVAIDIGDIPDGFYYCTIINPGNITRVIKFVKKQGH